MLLHPLPHPCTHHVSVNCHPGEVSNFKCKLVGRCKGVWTLALEESQMGTTGLIWRANDEAFYELISHRGRGGSFPGLELKKIAQDLNISENMAFLLQLVQDPARLQWPMCTIKGVTVLMQFSLKIHWSNEQTPKHSGIHHSEWFFYSFPWTEV